MLLAMIIINILVVVFVLDMLTTAVDSVVFATLQDPQVL